MNSNIKTSIKLRIDNPDKIINMLRRNGAVYFGGGLEKIKRFDTQDQLYEKNGKYFRIKEGLHNSFELKEKIDVDVKIRTRLDTEFEIEDVEKMEYLLNVLGLKYVRILEKYTQHWKYKNVNIVLDEVNFGFFIDIEGNDSDIEEFCDIMNLEKNNKILVTYWELFERISNERDILFNKDYISRIM